MQICPLKDLERKFSKVSALVYLLSKATVCLELFSFFLKKNRPSRSRAENRPEAVCHDNAAIVQRHKSSKVSAMAYQK
jgi:hypothetical protein